MRLKLLALLARLAFIAVLAPKRRTAHGLAVREVGVASGFPIATGKHIGDCDLGAFALSFVHTGAGS